MKDDASNQERGMQEGVSGSREKSAGILFFLLFFLFREK